MSTIFQSCEREKREGVYGYVLRTSNFLGVATARARNIKMGWPYTGNNEEIFFVDVSFITFLGGFLNWNKESKTEEQGWGALACASLLPYRLWLLGINHNERASSMSINHDDDPRANEYKRWWHIIKTCYTQNIHRNRQSHLRGHCRQQITVMSPPSMPRLAIPSALSTYHSKVPLPLLMLTPMTTCAAGGYLYPASPRSLVLSMAFILVVPEMHGRYHRHIA